MVKILVVEDDVRLNRLVCRLLSDYGYQPIGCGSAAEAFEAMEHEPFDMIITDVMMPGMDGFEFADAVRQQDREVPILFMTALDDMASKRKGFRIGIDDYMVKPLSYPKKTFTRAQLMDEFWGYETESDSRTVDVYITRLRNKFKACTAFEIVTVHGLGYKAVLHENGK